MTEDIQYLVPPPPIRNKQFKRCYEASFTTTMKIH